MNELKKVSVIKNLKVFFGNNAIVEYLEDIEVQKIEPIEKKLVFVYPFVLSFESKKEGLNKKARVTIYGYWPVGTNEQILNYVASNYPDKGIQDRFVYTLMKDKEKRFIDYNIETGKYVYEIDSFEVYK